MHADIQSHMLVGCLTYVPERQRLLMDYTFDVKLVVMSMNDLYGDVAPLVLQVQLHIYASMPSSIISLLAYPIYMDIESHYKDKIRKGQIVTKVVNITG